MPLFTYAYNCIIFIFKQDFIFFDIIDIFDILNNLTIYFKRAINIYLNIFRLLYSLDKLNSFSINMNYIILYIYIKIIRFYIVTFALI